MWARSWAVPVLEMYANHDENLHPDATFYALYCIRGDPSDLHKMVDLLETEEKYYGIKGGVISYLKALGVKAAPVADQVRKLLDSEEPLVMKYKKELMSFLDKVEQGEGPTVVLP